MKEARPFRSLIDMQTKALAVDIIGLVPLLLVIVQMLSPRRYLIPVRYLILSKLIADGLEIIVVMMLLVASQLIFGDWIQTKYRPIVGYLALSLQYSSFYTSLALTLNRFMVVMNPLRYNFLFNEKTTVIMVVICWLFAWIHNLIYLKPECSFTYDPTILQFVFSNDRCGAALSLYQDLVYNVVLALLSTAVDIFSLTRLRSMSSRTRRSPGESKREKPWFLQATINSFLYVLMLASFHISDYVNDVTVQFLLTVIVWQMWLSAAP
ncbi:hypothetical protein Y032_0040g240 [Ancylostoma ceylanicum]|uniref:G-protein coupled receptors family 1 profile domain-containing protein n=1 Tax=Ancylostoma ceylanicum TaxID=53326 RepID=A0A016UGN7_9BILA|nr:hypothetical protein Y032_0040g240 [Ancylostoma ceylanicum]